MKNQKGITLIALVITIIVLLILAGITIAMLAGENGILTNATKSRAYNDLGTAKDQIALKANETVSTYFTTTYVGSSASGNYKNSDVQKAVSKAVGEMADSLSSTAVMSPASSESSFTFKLTKGDYAVYGAINGNGSIKWGEIGYSDATKTGAANTVNPDPAS